MGYRTINRKEEKDKRTESSDFEQTKTKKGKLLNKNRRRQQNDTYRSEQRYGKKIVKEYMNTKLTEVK